MTNSTLTDKEFQGFHSNCMIDEQDGAIFLANNRVTGHVWRTVKHSYDLKKYAKYAVVPKDLLLELIAVLGGKKILNKFLEQLAINL